MPWSRYRWWTTTWRIWPLRSPRCWCRRANFIHTAAAETWSAVAGGDRSKDQIHGEQFGLVSESLVKAATSQSRGLARALIRVAETVERIGEPPPAEAGHGGGDRGAVSGSQLRELPGMTTKYRPPSPACWSSV